MSLILIFFLSIHYNLFSRRKYLPKIVAAMVDENPDFALVTHGGDGILTACEDMILAAIE